MKWYLKCLSRFLDFSGRSRRKEYWMFFLFNILFYVVLALFEFALKDVTGCFYGILSVIYVALMLVSGIAVFLRRLHDIGKSSWWFLYGLIPIVGPIILLIWLCKRGEDGDNYWGPNPKDEPDFTAADAWHDLKTNLKGFIKKKSGKIFCLLLAELIVLTPCADYLTRYETNFYLNNQSYYETELIESPTYRVVDTDEEGHYLNKSILRHVSATSGEKDILETLGILEIEKENKEGYAIISIDEGWGVYGPDGEKVLDGSKIPAAYPGTLSFVKGDDGKLLLEDSFIDKRYDLEGNYVGRSKAFLAEHIHHFGMAILVLVMLAVALLWYFLMWRKKKGVNADAKPMGEDAATPSESFEQQSAD